MVENVGISVALGAVGLNVQRLPWIIWWFIISQQKQQALQEQALVEQRQQNLRLVAQVAQLEAGMAQESIPSQFLVKLTSCDE
jgi:phage-related minor tail protein